LYWLRFGYGIDDDSMLRLRNLQDGIRSGAMRQRLGYGICAAETAHRLSLYTNLSNPNTLAVVGAISALPEERW
jgi:hypothetical protein